MKKDVVYIDVEDDITAIIGKIKSSKEQIVALVPPRRTGILQSAVNLRLLDRMAKSADKKLVIVSNNKSLVSLAAAAKIPVAKNLQSKPELAEITALKEDSEDDIIDGGNLPIGELDKTSPPELIINRKSIDDAMASLDEDDAELLGAQANAVPAKKSEHIPPGPKTRRIKVPDFGSFRKKLFIGGILGTALIAFLVWAMVFAPAATIIITAKTSAEAISDSLILSETATTSFDNKTLRVISKEYKKDQTLDFEATGQDNVGQKSAGVITIYNCDDTDGFTIVAGTKFVSVSSGLVYKNSDAIQVPAMTGKASTCQSTATHDGAGVKQANVSAEKAGEAYNIQSGSYDVSGFSYVYITGTAMSGGTTKIAKVVTDTDVIKAKEKLANTTDEVAVADLTKQFNSDQIAITSSLSVSRADATSTPAVGQESTGVAKLTSSVTYKMYVANKSEVKTLLNQQLEKLISGKKNTKIYSDGVDTAKITNFEKTDKVMSANLSTIARLGPVISEQDVKELAKGERYGQVQSMLEAIPGIESVDIKFSYFWVATVPRDTNKIKVEFKLDADK